MKEKHTLKHIIITIFLIFISILVFLLSSNEVFGHSGVHYIRFYHGSTLCYTKQASSSLWTDNWTSTATARTWLLTASNSYTTSTTQCPRML